MRKCSEISRFSFVDKLRKLLSSTNQQVGGARVHADHAAAESTITVVVVKLAFRLRIAYWISPGLPGLSVSRCHIWTDDVRRDDRGNRISDV